MLDHLDKLREGLGLRRLPPSQRVDRWIVARLDEGVSAADMLLALDLRAEEVRRDPRAARYFDAGSPFTGPGSSGPGGWAVSARMIDEAQRRGGTRGRAAAPHGAPAAEDAYQAQVAAERLADLQRREAELARTPRLAVVGGES